MATVLVRQCPERHRPEVERQDRKQHRSSGDQSQEAMATASWISASKRHLKLMLRATPAGMRGWPDGSKALFMPLLVPPLLGVGPVRGPEAQILATFVSGTFWRRMLTMFTPWDAGLIPDEADVPHPIDQGPKVFLANLIALGISRVAACDLIALSSSASCGGSTPSRPRPSLCISTSRGSTGPPGPPAAF